MWSCGTLTAKYADRLAIRRYVKSGGTLDARAGRTGLTPHFESCGLLPPGRRLHSPIRVLSRQIDSLIGTSRSFGPVAQSQVQLGHAFVNPRQAVPERRFLKNVERRRQVLLGVRQAVLKRRAPPKINIAYADVYPV